MLASFLEVLVERAGARIYGVRVDGDVVAGAQLMVLDGVAQVEDVVTLTAHRGQGYARAAVLAAVRAARNDGADLVYLGADDEDWPKHMYAKLGFDEVARSFDFVRKPPQRA
jgi:predicted GNAT family acetyltransferase